MMKNIFFVFIAILLIFPVSCHKEKNREQLSNSISPAEKQMINYMTPAERKSVKFSAVSGKQKYYNAVANIAEHIQEMSVYDEELGKTYVIHITLPPDYDKNKSYPMYMMTDGIWRLIDHAVLRLMMVNREIEDVIVVSIGYDYGIDAEKPETRLVELVRGSDLFLNFITNNLAPYLGELYNIDYECSALMGHSLGGLFAYYAVFNHYKYLNRPFNNYVIASPSFFILDNQSYYNSYWRYGDIEKVYFLRNETLEKKIFLTAGINEEYPDMLENIENFLQRSKQYGITTIDYELYYGSHSSYVGEMIQESILRFYKK